MFYFPGFASRPNFATISILSWLFKTISITIASRFAQKGCAIRARVMLNNIEAKFERDDLQSKSGFPIQRFPDITVARHLPGTYRSHATSFIAISSQGIHHTLLNFLLENSKTTDYKYHHWYFIIFILHPSLTLRIQDFVPRFRSGLNFILLHRINYITILYFVLLSYR